MFSSFLAYTYLTANIGHNPIYVWRSILRARFIVRGGVRWSIGTGEAITLLDEPCLLNDGFIKGNIEGAHFVRNFAVNSFLKNTAKRWNEPLIRQVFSHDISSSIISTSLIAKVQHDRLILKAEKNGVYFMRSANKLCVEELIDTSHLRSPGYW